MLAAVHERIALTRPGDDHARRELVALAGRRAQPDEAARFIAAVHTGPDGDDGFVVATPA